MVKVNAIFQGRMTEGVQGTNASDRVVADKDILVRWMALSALLYTPRDQPGYLGAISLPFPLQFATL